MTGLMCLALTLSAPLVSAADWPAYYPERLPRKGVVGKVDSSLSRIEINGNSLALDRNVRVHSLTTEFSSVHALKPEDAVGYRVEQDRSGRKVVKEIWVLPEGSVEAP
jgi:hypothetical protein